MPGRKTPLITDHYYHVFNKGVNGGNIFSNQRNFQRMVNCLWLYRYLSPPLRMSYLLRQTDKEILKIKSLLKDKEKLVDILVYSLMSNHFHFLVRQLTDNGISIFMNRLQNSYARYFNTEQTRHGPLFQGRFKAVLIESEEQLIHVSRYIHLNPFSASVVKDLPELRQYPWCSLQEYLTKTANICETKMLSDIFETPDKHWQFISDHADYQRKLEQNKHLNVE